MQWLINNWTLLIVIFAFISVGFHYFRKFQSLPSEEQLIKVREFLLWAVFEAEKYYGEKTGQIKLRYVYSLFCEHFPSLVALIPFDIFESLVDAALEQMRHLLETNEYIKKYVEEKKE